MLLIGGILRSGHRPWFWLATLAFLVSLAGIAMVALRRRPYPPRRLSKGKFQRLPSWLAAYGFGALLTSLAGSVHAWPLLILGLPLALAAGIALLLEIRNGPMRHAVAGAIHLAFHPRPARFRAGGDTRLSPIDLTRPHLGIETPADFAWPALAGLDACVQCGRCEEACPAYAAGMPLNPKKLIQDLASCLSPGGNDVEYRGSPHPGRPVGRGHGGPGLPIVGLDAMVVPDTLWSCTTCRACVEACPMMIEHVDAIVGLRQFQTLDLGSVPEKAAAALDELRYADNPGGRALSERTQFAAGLRLPIAAEGDYVDTLLWLGDGAFDLRYGRTLRALIQLLDRGGVEFAVLGPAERDCGDLARRLGDEATFVRLARENIATLDRYRFRRILTADPHAYHVLRQEYPAYGGHYAVIHHTSLLADLVEQKRLRPLPSAAPVVTYHDPCYLGRYSGEVDRPRDLLRAIGIDLVEMQRSGLKSMCCGAGGGAAISDVQGERRIPDLRMQQAASTGAAIVAVACPNCTAMLEGVTGTRPEVRDVAELLLAALEPA